MIVLAREVPQRETIKAFGEYEFTVIHLAISGEKINGPGPINKWRSHEMITLNTLIKLGGGYALSHLL